jgi:hypothetical protein
MVAILLTSVTSHRPRWCPFTRKDVVTAPDSVEATDTEPALLPLNRETTPKLSGTAQVTSKARPVLPVIGNSSALAVEATSTSAAASTPQAAKRVRQVCVMSE